MTKLRLGISLVLVSTAALAVASCRDAARADATEQTATPAVRVSVARVEGRDEPVTIEATGAFQADEASGVAPEASGRVEATPVDIGQFVRQGAPLVMLQAVDATLRLEAIRATVARAEANLRFAESQYTLAQTTSQRYTALLATGDVSRTVADQASTAAETSLQSVKTARASVVEARAQLALAEEELSHVSVTAPFSGYISTRHVSVGEYVQPSTPVVTLLKVDPLRLSLAIPSVQAGQVALGQEVVRRAGLVPLEPMPAPGSAISSVLVGGYRESLANLWSRRFPAISVQVQMELPLRNRTALAQVARTQIVERQFERDRQRLEQLIVAEVRNALQAVQSSSERLNAAGAAHRYAQEQYDSERRRFDAGMSTVFLVLERQTALVTAQAQEVRARADLNLAIAIFDRAVGRTLEQHGVRLDTTL